MSRELHVARLRGRLAVLLGMHEELHAIGASHVRIDRNCAEIARVRAELARLAGD
jgi:hypothetical protein